MILSPGVNDVDMADRFWACTPSVRADGKTRLTKQKERLAELALISSWLSDASFSTAFAKQLSNQAKPRVYMGDGLSNAVEDLAHKIMLGLWHTNPSTPLRGNSNASALVQFNATLLALRTLIHKNQHVQAAEDVVLNSSSDTRQVTRLHYAAVKQWCEDIGTFVDECAEIAGKSFDQEDLDKAKSCIALAGRFPAPPGRKPLAQVALERRASVATALEEEDEDGFAPVRTELKGSPTEPSGDETCDEEASELLLSNPLPPSLASLHERPQFYEGFAADGYSDCGCSDGSADNAPVVVTDKRRVRRIPLLSESGERDQKRAKCLTHEKEDAKNAKLHHTRVALAHGLVAYAHQLHELQLAGPRFSPNLGWASQEVFDIAKEITGARKPAGAPGQRSNGSSA